MFLVNLLCVSKGHLYFGLVISTTPWLCAQNVTEYICNYHQVIAAHYNKGSKRKQLQWNLFNINKYLLCTLKNLA